MRLQLCTITKKVLRIKSNIRPNIYSSKIIFNSVEAVHYVYKAVQYIYMVVNIDESIRASRDTSGEK